MFDCIIVNYNSRGTLKNCIESLRSEKIDNLNKIIVVDNNSSDNSYKFLEDCDTVNLVKLNKNFGFAKGCNIGASHADSDYFFFLNPDTIINNSNLDSIFNFLVKNPNVGIAGPQIFDKKDNFVMTSRHFPCMSNVIIHQSGLRLLSKNLSWLIDQNINTPSSEVSTIIGAAFMVRRKLFKSLNGFDEDYFVYFEEVDFCLRAKKAGYKTMFLSSSNVKHIGNITSKSVPIDVLSYSLMSRLIYFKKHKSVMEFSIMLCYMFSLEFFIRSIKSILRGNKTSIVYLSYFNLIFKFKIFNILFKIRNSNPNQIKRSVSE